jgi:predicted RNA methylase
MDISQMTASEGDHRKSVLLPQGKGIGPYWAALCVNDLMRTRTFIRGLYFAVKASKKRFPDTPIHVLYAGTGPFATLALPLTTLFTPNEVQFTCLEANPLTVEMLHRTIEAFGIQPFIKDVILTDATIYHPTDTVHILLSETMQHALDKEPQVAITQNLVPYLHPDGFLIPESIVIQAGLLNPADEMKRLQDFINPPEYYIRYLDVIFDLNRHTAISYANEFPVIEIEVSSKLTKEYPELNLFTHIRVFGDEIITPWQSGLSLPKKIARLDHQDPAHHRVSFQYMMGYHPGFSFRFL